MACQKIGFVLCRNTHRTTALSAVSKIPAFTCASLASGGATLHGEKPSEAVGTKSQDKTVNGSASSHGASGSHRHQNVKKRGEELLSRSGRAYSSTAPQVNPKTYLWARYNEMKRLVHGMLSRLLLFLCVYYLSKVLHHLPDNGFRTPYSTSQIMQCNGCRVCISCMTT